MRGGAEFLVRHPTGRQLSNRVRRAPDREEYIRAWLGVAAGTAQLVSFYATAEPPIFDDVGLRVSGLPSSVKPPDRNLRRELSKLDLSFGSLNQNILVDASDEEFKQARRDWRLIDGLIEYRPGSLGIGASGIVNLSRGGILLPSVARRFGAEKSLARL
jgi:hypothetical protein